MTLTLAKLYRVALFSCLLFLELVLPGGVLSFYLTLVALALSVALYAWRPPAFPLLVMFWEVAFLLVLAIEGIGAAGLIEGDVGARSFAIAARCINAANAAFLLGHALVYVERPLSSPVYRARLLRKPGSLGLYFVALLYGLFLVTNLPLALAAAIEGRAAGHPALTLSERPWFAALSAAGMVLPALISCVLRMRWPGRRIGAALIVLATPIFVIQFALGTRFALLYSFTGMMMIVLSAREFSRWRYLRLGILSTLLFACGTLMAATRAGGFRHSSVQMTLDYLTDTRLVQSEGAVHVAARIVDYMDTHAPLYGKSSAAMLVSWVPRELWEQKPTFLGYWFIREYGGARYSEGHSAAAGFVGDALLDFGPSGAVMVWLMIGLAFGGVERWARRMIVERSSPGLLAAAMLYPATYFAVRSFDTAFITYIGCVTLVLLFETLSRAATLRASGVRVSRNDVVSDELGTA